MYDVKGKVVIITGAATGIGAGLTQAFLDDGAKYVAVLDIDEIGGLKFVDELKTKFGDNKAEFIKCDVTKDEQLFRAYEKVKGDNGQIDVVVNNAGFANDQLHTYKKEIELNVTALVTSTIKALELMRKDKGGEGGTIVNISSVTALGQTPGLPIYAATKSAILQFSLSISYRHKKSCSFKAKNDTKNLNIISGQIRVDADIYYSRTDVRVISMCFGLTDTILITRFGNFDEYINDVILPEYTKHYPLQSVESAVNGTVEAFKHGENGSVWLAANNKPVRNITEDVKRAYEILSKYVFET